MVEKKKKTKKDLKQKVKKKLDKMKKKMPKKDFKKVAKKVMTKVDRTKGSEAIGNILDRLRQTIPPPPQIVQDPRLAATQLKDRLEKETKVELAKPIKDFKAMKKAYNEVLKKYESGNLDPTDLFVLYTATKQFATTANDYIPSQAEIGGAYRTVKSKLNYFKNWINSNLPSGQSRVQDIPDIRRPPTPPPQQPPTPTPTPTPTPPPPTPPPTLQTIYDNLPDINLAKSSLAVGALATGGILNRLNNRINRNQRNIENLGRGVGNQLAQNIAEASLGQAIGNTMSQTIANVNSNLDEIENIFDNVVNINQNTLNNRNIRSGSRPPLRQRQRDENLRLEIGKKQTKSRGSKLIDEYLQEKRKNKPPTQEEIQEVNERKQRGLMEDQLGSILPPDVEPDFETMKISLESFSDQEREQFGGLSDANIQRLVDREIELRQNIDKFENQLAGIPEMPNVPQQDIQTRTEEDIMEGLRN